MEIRSAGELYHKIGITGRRVEERLKEIEQEVRKLDSMTVSIKHQITGYAFLESFFKRKYAGHRFDFDRHSEYFSLPTTTLQEILENLERLEYLSLDRIGKIKAGMQKAKARGKHIGRPSEAEKLERFLQKPKSQEIRTLLDQGHSLREIQRRTGYAINTIRKVNQTIKQKQ